LLGHREIVYGAASKGIIKRDQQNNAVVYKTAYAAANPFQQMDPIELEKYKKEVTQKQMKEQGKLQHFETLEHLPMLWGYQENSFI
jgi:hypothetical protein